MNQFEAEIKQLEQDLADGIIDQQEFNKQYNQMMRDYRAEAEEAAQDAYDREMERW